jgi:cytochrome c oxidase subunit 4
MDSYIHGGVPDSMSAATLQEKSERETQKEHSSAKHASVGTYLVVAVVLAVVTLTEVGIVYVESARSFLVPILLLLSAAKFLLVAGFYMHLRFDSPVFRRLFGVGIAGSIAIYAAVLAMFAARG